MKKLLLCLLILLTVQAVGRASQPTICLNMIVKDETPVITRCLKSVKPLIDYWVIVDTGSSDGTQAMIKEFMSDIPGELHERPWVNFGHNRNEALQLAQGKGDYILLIDADEELSFKTDFKLPELDKDFYYIETSLGGMKYKRVQLVNNHLDWKWIGVLHETIQCPRAKTVDTINGVVNVAKPEGNRSKDPQKFQKDAKLLETALKTEPNNTRYVFYLAQSYRDAGDLENALKNYERRITMKGWDQEVFWSMLQVALLKEALGKDSKEVIDSYKQAYAYRPTRVEPLYYLAVYQRKLNNYEESYKAACQGLALKESDDILFLSEWITDYGLLLEYSIAAYWTGHYLESLIASKLILSNPSLPDNVIDCVEKNLAWINLKMAESTNKTDQVVKAS